ncbi:MAG: methionine--tRNA ligase [Candidatus Bathyarchaeia archaeon]
MRWVVTAAWPYVNTTPHLGTFLQLLTGDVFARYRRLMGDEVLYVSGSDAHGTPILVSAEREGLTAEQVAFKYHAEYLRLLKDWNIQFATYTITHNPTHIRFCQGFYRRLYENGYIYAERSLQTYCEHEQRFLPDRFVEGNCPYCGAPGARGDQCTNPACERLLTPTELVNPYCVVCRNPPVLRETTHWYFDLPKFADRLREFLEKNTRSTEAARLFSLRMIQEGLKARPVTRDLDWGIPAAPAFEGAEGKVLYVWAEAVLGYISATVEWAERRGEAEAWKRFWLDPETRTVFCVGKDNTVFHLVIFPALLMASKEPYVLPYAVTVTEFIMYENQPFSKSKGVGVWADEALRLAPADYWRFILMANRPETRDMNFTWEDFAERVNGELNDNLGNFVHRTLTFIYRYFDGQVPKAGPLNAEDKELLEGIAAAARQEAAFLDEFRFRDALEAALALSRKGNVYLSRREPWRIVKTDRDAAATVLNVSAQVVKALAVLIAPFLPETANRIWDMLGLQGTVYEAGFHASYDSPLPAGENIKKPKPLFAKVNAEELAQRLKALRAVAEARDGLAR